MDRGQLDRAQAELQAMEKLDDKALEGSDAGPDEARLLMFGAAGQLALRRADAKGGVAIADRACRELAARQRLSFLEMAVDLYLAGDELDKARGALDDLKKGVDAKLAADREAAEALAVLNAAVTVKDPKANPFEAISRLREVVLAKPNHARAWKILGDAYLRSGQGLRAMAAYEQRLRLVHDDRESALALARIYLTLEPRQAVAYAVLAERGKPGDLQPQLVRIAAEIDVSRTDPSGADRSRLGKECSGPAPGPSGVDRGPSACCQTRPGGREAAGCTGGSYYGPGGMPGQGTCRRAAG